MHNLTIHSLSIVKILTSAGYHFKGIKIRIINELRIWFTKIIPTVEFREDRVLPKRKMGFNLSDNSLGYLAFNQFV